MEYQQGMLHLLANEVIAQGGRVVTHPDRKLYVIYLGEEVIITPVPSADQHWARLIGDLVHAGMCWPPPIRQG